MSANNHNLTQAIYNYSVLSIIFLPTILNYLNDRERACHYFCRILAHPPPRPPPTPQCLTTLMTESAWVPLSFVGFWRPLMTPPPPQTVQYLTIYKKKEGGGARHALSCEGLRIQLLIL